MTIPMNEIPSELLEVTNDLAKNLAQSEPFLRLKRANNMLESDPQASQLWTQFSLMQQKVRSQQYSDDYSQADVIKLHALRNLIEGNQIIKERAAAQEAAINLLREVNLEISRLLRLDFADLTRSLSNE